MTKERIEKAVDVINYAIRNQISVKEASVKCGFADTYVKNVKAVIYEKYENGTLEDELFSLFDDAYNNYLNSKGNSVCDSEDKPMDLPPSTKGEKTKFKSDGNNAEFEWVGGDNYGSDHIRTLDQLLSAAEVDTDIWNVKNYVINKWDVTSWKEGYPDTRQNFQVKAWLERNAKAFKEVVVGEIFQQMVRDYEPPISSIIPKTLRDIITPTSKKERKLLEISIFDLHIGKLAWGGETFENYDVKIARERFLTSITNLIEYASGFNYSRILFPVGSDFFNSDTIYNTTTKGTPQDEDLRWQKTFNVGVRLLVDAINLLKQTGVPIDVVVIPGNHDFERSFYMGAYLEAWFKSDAAVNINNGASPRKYYRYGNVLLGLTHGSEEKEGSLPMLMATDIESKPMWSETKFHEWHLGHIHRKRTMKYEINKSRLLNEDLGVTIRYLSSLTGTEEWHHKKGFVGSTKAADAFIWDYDFGLVAHLNTNLILD